MYLLFKFYKDFKTSIWINKWLLLDTWDAAESVAIVNWNSMLLKVNQSHPESSYVYWNLSISLSNHRFLNTSVLTTIMSILWNQKCMLSERIQKVSLSLSHFISTVLVAFFSFPLNYPNIGEFTISIKIGLYPEKRSCSKWVRTQGEK